MEQKSKYIIIYKWCDGSIEILHFNELSAVLDYVEMTDNNFKAVERKHKIKVYEYNEYIDIYDIYKDTGIGQATKKELAELRKENPKNETK